ncbi:MAG: molybdenum cofactor biosynthesis protein MoaE, partial [Gammaproteobacteria bacterium]
SEAMTRFGLMDTLIIHRIGALLPGDPIVLCATWSAHRAAAFEACRFLIEDLKSRAPLWKRETLDSSVRWVEHNTPS